MARTPGKASMGKVSPIKTSSKTPAKTPIKTSVQTPAKTPVKTPFKTPKGTQPSLQKTSKSQRKRGIKVGGSKDEEIESKKVKQAPTCRKSVPFIIKEEVEESDDSSPAKNEIEDQESDKDEIESNIAMSGDSDDQNEEESDDGTELTFERTLLKKQVKLSGKLKTENELHDTPTIFVENLRKQVTDKELRAHFAPCGGILYCKFIKKNNTGAFIQFENVAEAKCAEAMKNNQPFQGQPLYVKVMQATHFFTREDTVTVKNLPQGVASKVYKGVREAMLQYGKVKLIRFKPNMTLGDVQFKDKSGVTAALKAGSFNLMETKVFIKSYSHNISKSPETMVILYGLDAGTTEADIKQALSKRSIVVSLYFPKSKNDGSVLTNQVFVDCKSEEDAQTLLTKNTIKVKNATVDVLPHLKRVVFIDTMKKLSFRHPAGVFAENLPRGTKYAALQEEFSKFGPIQWMTIHKNICAIVIFEQKADAQNALKSGVSINGVVMSLHPIDGTYMPGEKPSLAVERTVYFSNINGSRYIPDLINQIEMLEYQYTRIILNKDPLTNFFRSGVYVEFKSAEIAKQVINTKFKLNYNAVKLEMYDPAKYDIVSLDNVILVEDLKDNTKDVDLWRSFQQFGMIRKTVVMNDKGPTGYGYVEFCDIGFAKKALETEYVEVNGGQAKVITPTQELLEKLRKKLLASFQSKFKQQKIWGKPERSPWAMRDKPAFKKTTFRKGGFKPPRRFL